MLGIINEQADWYLKKSRQFDSVRMKMLELTESGRAKKGRILLEKLEKFQQTANFASAMVRAFGGSINQETQDKINEQIKAISELIKIKYKPEEFTQGGIGGGTVIHPNIKPGYKMPTLEEFKKMWDRAK